jgi:hypothetical protein
LISENVSFLGRLSIGEKGASQQQKIWTSGRGWYSGGGGCGGGGGGEAFEKLLEHGQINVGGVFTCKGRQNFGVKIGLRICSGEYVRARGADLHGKPISNNSVKVKHIKVVKSIKAKSE